MKMSTKAILSSTAALVFGALSTPAWAGPVVVPLTTGNYAWTYQGNEFGFNGQNMTTTFGGFYQSILPEATTGSGHDCKSFIRFDLTGISLSPGATVLLHLNSVGGTAYNPGFGTSPTPSAPAIVGLSSLTSAWNTGSISFLNQPTVSNDPNLNVSFTVDSFSSTAVNPVDYAVDVTAIVSAWLADPSTNFGLALTRVLPDGNTGDVVLPIFSSGGPNGGGAAAGPAPFLEISGAIVPEPSGVASVMLLSFACLPLARGRRVR